MDRIRYIYTIRHSSSGWRRDDSRVRENIRFKRDNHIHWCVQNDDDDDGDPDIEKRSSTIQLKLVEKKNRRQMYDDDAFEIEIDPIIQPQEQKKILKFCEKTFQLTDGFHHHHYRHHYHSQQTNKKSWQYILSMY